MTIDLARARAETPGCSNTVAHLNAAGAALMPDPVLAAIKGHLDREAMMGGYEAEDAAHELLENMYSGAARLIGAAADEIAFIENATRAWDMAFYGLVQSFRPGDRILTFESEYASNYLAMLHMVRHRGVVIEVIPGDADGCLSLDALDAAIDGKVRLIAMTHVPTNGGLVNPAAAVGQIARRHDIPYLLDACQSVGQMQIDVGAIGCDMLSVTGRKFLRGPRGTGFLYVRRDFIKRLEPPMIDLRSATWTARGSFEIDPGARRFENWECNVAGKIGLGVAIDYALNWGLDQISSSVKALAEGARSRLAAIPGVNVRDLGREKCAIVTFDVEGVTPVHVQRVLAARAINVSVSDPASTRLDMDRRDLSAGLVRASVHYYNTFDELDRLADAVEAAART